MQRDATCCGDVGDACRQAGGQRVQHAFDRRRADVLTAQHGRVIRLGRESHLVAVFTAGAGESAIVVSVCVPRSHLPLARNWKAAS